ncbi:ferredoxin Fer [Halorhabdus sp. BNX81]|uniref:ferredoxin Fer n=1 Tax=Halorhabdus sp. BNX81 TaxID=2980181 RepID=UPI0023DD2991|nr:ferredoxin Fer [Halorhabdus sp. BNX81]WEL21179.1 DnaJ-like chaperone fused to ferredoxin [Halorhabdus sp. BNX81]
MPSPYQILEIDRAASEDAIHRAYRRRVKEAHPDQGGSAAEFQAVQSAYEALLSQCREDGDEQARSDQSVAHVTVEYLDYDVLDDHGWDLDDEDLFSKAAGADLGGAEHGTFSVTSERTLLESAEATGHEWPYSCRGGACANCAVAVLRGELSQPVNHILPADAIDRGIRLSCVGEPITDELTVVYNVKHLPSIADLRLPPRPADSRGID